MPAEVRENPLLTKGIFDAFFKEKSLTKNTYRKARNKESYRATHERGIIPHEAAVKALKAAGVSKLPDITALQAEYEKMQEQKETLRADYGKRKKQVA